MSSPKGPEAEYSQKLANLFQEYAQAIAKESGATGVRVMCEFSFKKKPSDPKGKGDLKMRTFTTPDARVERMGDGKVRPRGSNLQRKVDAVLLKAATTYRKRR